MKKKTIIMIIIIVLILLITILGVLFGYFFPKNLSGLSTKSKVNLSCDKDAVSSGQIITCSIEVNVISGKMTSFTGSIKLSDNLNLISSSYTSNWSKYSTAKNGKFKLSTSNMYDGNVDIGTIVLKVNGSDDETHKINLNNIIVGDENYNEVDLGGISSEIYTLSSNANLIDLSVNPGYLTPAFNENITNYNVVTNSSFINISAIAHKGGIVTGIGQKNLNYGNNSFIITSASESGNKKQYTINVVRNDNRSGNNYLNSLSVSNTNIKFNSNIYNYTSVVKYDVSKINIYATAKDSKASIQGIGDKNLKVGKNSFSIVITAENGSVKTYFITIIRQNKEGTVNISQDNSLKNLNIKGANIDFNKDILNYDVIVSNNVTELKINYETSSDKAVVNISGSRILMVGMNKIEINVLAEDGSIRTYVLNITREKNKDKIINNEEEIVNKIKDISNDDDVIVTVNENDKNKTVSSNIINELINSNKNLSYNVIDKKGIILYSVKIDSDKLVTNKEFSYYLTFKSDYEDILKSLTENNLNLPLNFKFHGSLPGNIEFSVYVKNVLDTSKKYDLYYFNTKNNILELEISNVPIKNGYADFELNHFSEYVLLEKEPLYNKKSIIPIIIMILIAILVIGVIIYLIKKPNNRKKTYIKFYDFEKAEQSNF